MTVSCSQEANRHGQLEIRYRTRRRRSREQRLGSHRLELRQKGARGLRRLCDLGYEVLLETGGGLDIGGVDPRVRRIVDVKCPASGESENNLWANFDLLTPHDELKFVLAGEADYRWACEVVERHRLAGRCAIHFSPVHGSLEPRDLASWILRDRLLVRMQLQLHKLLWGAARGV